jgi:hypothetical protein
VTQELYCLLPATNHPQQHNTSESNQHRNSSSHTKPKLTNSLSQAWKNGVSAPCRAEGLAADLLEKTDERENPSQGISYSAHPGHRRWESQAGKNLWGERNFLAPQTEELEEKSCASSTGEKSTAKPNCLTAKKIGPSSKIVAGTESLTALAQLASSTRSGPRKEIGRNKIRLARKARSSRAGKISAAEPDYTRRRTRQKLRRRNQIGVQTETQGAAHERNKRAGENCWVHTGFTRKREPNKKNSREKNENKI